MRIAKYLQLGRNSPSVDPILPQIFFGKHVQIGIRSLHITTKSREGMEGAASLRCRTSWGRRSVFVAGSLVRLLWIKTVSSHGVDGHLRKP